MRKGLKICQKMECWFIVLAFGVMVLAAFIQVFNRNITQISSLTGLEELSKYCMIYMVLLGTELGLRDGTQIAVTALVDRAKGLVKKVLLIVAKSIVVVFSAVMCYQGFTLVQQQIVSGQKSPGLQIPMSVPYGALVISFGVITLVQGITVVLMIKNVKEPKCVVQETQGGEN